MVKCVRRYHCPNKPVTSDGCRFKLYYPNGGYYSGYWRKNKNHGFGVKLSPERNSSFFADKREPNGQLIYKGDWYQDRRQGSGSMLRKRGTDIQTIYTGQWYDDMKCGEGKKFYEDGCVYFGQWLRNCRHGLGILWYGDGSIYVGEWETDYKHGLGVMFYGECPSLFLRHCPLYLSLTLSKWQPLRGSLRQGLQEWRGHLLPHAHWSNPKGHMAQRHCEGVGDAGWPDNST